MNNIMKFENMDVDIIVENDEPLFEVYSTGMALGQIVKAKGSYYPRKARIDENIKSAEIKPVVRGGSKYLTLNDVRKLISMSHSRRRHDFIEWLKYNGFIDQCEIFGTERKEEIFADALSQVLHQFDLSLQAQKVEGNYRFDMYVPELDIVIEYDENGHSDYNIDKEEERENYIRQNHKALIRVTDFYSIYSNIGKVIKKIVKFMGEL